MRPIFKYSQRKRKSSTNGTSDSPCSTPSPVSNYVSCIICRHVLNMSKLVAANVR